MLAELRDDISFDFVPALLTHPCYFIGVHKIVDLDYIAFLNMLIHAHSQTELLLLNLTVDPH